MSIGTSSVVYPAAGFADQAKTGNAVIVEINPEETPVTPLADFSLQGNAGEVLPLLIAAIKSSIGRPEALS